MVCIWYKLCRRFHSPLYRKNPLYGQTPTSFISFFQNLYFWKRFFNNIIQMKYKINKQHYMLFYTQHFYKQQQAEIWLEIITTFSIKRSSKKKKNWKLMICWVKRVIATKSTCPSSTDNYIYPPFIQEIDPSPFLWFFKKYQSPINKGRVKSRKIIELYGQLKKTWFH